MTEQVNTPVQQEELEWPIERVRQTFIDYFVQQKGHTFVPSSAIVIPQDETLLFTNAGMNQFKPIFLGQVDPNSELASLKRAANSQKCIRAGGKHNDLKDVGRDSYHHTMFEMLGSWSFGDYFKVDCIKWAWELLTEVFKMDKSRLYATYFGGDEGLGLAPDEEAKNEWLKYLPEERILASGLKDNFWEMGATGPCGPCSEIHYDKVGNGYGRSRVNEDDPLVIEIWNLVFIQYVREEEGGTLKPLPAKHCDTGMGLERLTSILQHKQTNYDIDIFQKLFANIQRVTKARAYTGKYYEDDKDGVDMAYRIVADHIRTITLAISDGVLPSNIGRGYVLRRIIRRAVRYGLEILGDERGFFSALAPVVVELMSGAFPTLLKDVDNVVKIIRDEEMQFSRTLHMGLKRLNRIIQGKEKGYVIPGEESAKLNHTYGFPFDLTRRIAKEKGYNVDKKAHEAAMLKNAGKESNELQKMEVLPLHGEAIVTLTDDGIVLSDDTHKYNPVSLKGRLVAIWLGRKKGFSDKIDRSHLDDTAVDSDNPKNHIGLIFDKTPFYAEQGGQIHDIGEIKFTPANGGELVSFNVESVQVYGGYVVHYGTASGEFKVDDEMDLIVNLERRKPITSNHTSTHLVNHSLRNTLGNHIEQQGSQVLDTRFRFDFAHTKPLSAEELLKVDEAVSQSIEGDHKVYYKDVPLAKAREILGVRQMFGEKYPDPVRVVSIGVSVDDLLNDPTSEKWLANAIEFCGGTHSISTKEIEAFATVSEDAVAKGVRRIVCVTGNDARQAIENADNFQKKMEQTLEGKTHNDLSNAASTLLKELDAEKVFPYGRKLRFRELLSDAKKLSVQQVKELEKEYKKTAATFTADAIKRIQEDKVSFLVEYLNIGVNCTLLKSTIKDVQKKFPTTPICLISFEAGKFAAVASTDKEHQDKLPANKWISETMVAINGKGGGKADNAQGVGAGEESQAQALVDAAKNFATSALQ